MQSHLRIEGQPVDLNYLRYTGWEESNPDLKIFFSPDTVKLISKKVTELTRGVDPLNRPIIVPPYRIGEVMSSVFSRFRPSTGDIYSRYNIPSDANPDTLQTLIDRTIELITSAIRNELGTEQGNQTLSAWVQVYGDFNTHGLRQHPPITTRDKKPNTMMFNMNY